MPLTPALGRQRQADLCEFEAWSTRASSRTGTKATEKPCLENETKTFAWVVLLMAFYSSTWTTEQIPEQPGFQRNPA